MSRYGEACKAASTTAPVAVSGVAAVAFVEGVKSLFDELIGTLEMAALNLRLHTLRQFGLTGADASPGAANQPAA
jgi:hypothetical protein